MKTPITEQIAEVEISTQMHNDGTFSYSFTMNGNAYGDFDFTSRRAALEEAKSVARTLHAYLLNGGRA